MQKYLLYRTSTRLEYLLNSKMLTIAFHSYYNLRANANYDFQL